MPTISNDPTISDVTDKRNGRPKTSERSGSQLGIVRFGMNRPELPTNYKSNWFNTVRSMRIDPTIALIRDLVVGPIVSAGWSVAHKPNAPAGAVDLITNKFLNLRDYIVRNTVVGLMDFGWQSFEKIWAIDDDGSAVLDKVKPLLQDITTILVNKNNGEYVGVVQNAHGLGSDYETKKIGEDLVFGDSFLKAHETILCNTNVEGTYWYGRAWMENMLLPYLGWNTVNDAADRYDRKISGSHWVVRFPVGQTPYGDTRELTDNYIIARDMIRSLENSGALYVPRSLDRTLQEMSDKSGQEDAWIIELLSDQSSQQAAFIDRLAYYDALKARALGFPERSVFQGQFGTKAEAETHADLAVVIAEMRHKEITEMISNQTVDDYLRYNYGRKAVGTVYLKTSPIADDLRKFLRQIFITLLQSNPQTALETISRAEIQSRLGLPTTISRGEDGEFTFPEVEAVVNKLNPVGTQQVDNQPVS